MKPHNKKKQLNKVVSLLREKLDAHDEKRACLLKKIDTICNKMHDQIEVMREDINKLLKGKYENEDMQRVN